MDKGKFWLIFKGGVKGILIGLILNIFAFFATLLLLGLSESVGENPIIPFILNTFYYLFPMHSTLWIVMPQVLVIPILVYFIIGAYIRYRKISIKMV